MAVIIAFSGINQLQSINKFGVPTLIVPSVFELASGREFLVPFLTVPNNIRLQCALPAVLLTSLFFMDQNISARVVNREENGLKKGAAYNVDMMALGLITGGKYTKLNEHRQHVDNATYISIFLQFYQYLECLGCAEQLYNP